MTQPVAWTLRLAVLTALIIVMLVGCRGDPSTPDQVQEPLPPRPPVLDEIKTQISSHQQYAEAAARARELLVEFERQYGAESIETAWLLDLLVEALRRDVHGHKDETLRLVERAVAVKEKILGPDHLEVTRSLLTQGSVHTLRNEDEKAERIFTDVVARREQALPPGDREIWMARIHLALFYLRRDRYDEAAAEYERALAGLPPAEEADRKQLADRSLTLHSIGMVKRRLEKYTEALRLYDEVLETRRQLGQDLHIAAALNSLALLEDDLGLYGDAEEHYLEAFEIRQRHPDADPIALADLHNNLGTTYRAMGRYDEALEQFDRARDIDTERESEILVAHSKHNTARTLSLMGDYHHAGKLFEEALRTRLERLPEDDAEIADTREYLTLTLLAMEDCARATAEIQEAMRIAREKYASSPVELARFLSTRARVEEQCGSRGRAKTLLEEAVEAQTGVLTENHPWTADTLRALASHHARSGEYEKALEIQNRAVAGLRRSLPGDHPLLLQALVEVAELRACTGDRQAAFEQVVQAERRARDHVRSAIRVLPARQALKYAGTLASGRNLTLSLTASGESNSERAVRESWDVLVASRQLVLEEMTARWSHAHGSADADELRLRRELEAGTRRLAEVLVRGPAGRSPERYRELIEKLIEEKERLERSLARRSDEFRAQRTKPTPDFGDVDDALSGSKAMVAFAKYEHSPCLDSAGGVAGTIAVPAEHYVAFVRPPGGEELTFHVLGPATRIDGLAREWVEGAGEPPPADAAAERAAEQELSRVGAELKRMVWDPVSSHIGSAEEVVLVPAGELHLVNFGALPAPDGRYLIETGPLARYVSAERDLVQGQRAEGKIGQRLLAIGGPNYNSARPVSTISPALPSHIATRATRENAKCPHFEDLWFTTLPEASREAKEVAGLWRAKSIQHAGAVHASNDQRDDDGVVVLTDEEATEAAFKNWAPGSQVLHISTHAFALEGNCPSIIKGARGGSGRRGIGKLGPAAGGRDPALPGDNPLLLAGLAFANANHRGETAPGGEDGILTAAEVASLNLQGVMLAVLSACDTGRGQIETGEGVYGLRRAFEIAGAESVVVSLWKVDDLAARQWMTELYGARLSEGKRLSEAIRSASLALLRGRRENGRAGHPFWWAPFVGVGSRE